jgi:long-chain fatty acid transport protein
MKTTKTLFRRACGALAALAALGLSPLGAGRAHASGFETARFGSVDGNAAGATPFALYYNPAALATTRRIHVAGNLTLALLNASYTRPASDTTEPSDAQGANSGKATLSNVLTAPSLAASMRFGDWAAGIGFFVPMGGQLSWGRSGGTSYPGYPGASDGPARWWMVEGSTSVLYGSAGASYTYRPLRLSFGASANLTYTSMDFTRALTASFTDAVNAEGRTHVTVSKASGSFGLGTLWEALENQLWLGLSYQAPPGLYAKQELEGTNELAFSGTATKEKVTLHRGLPDILRFAVRFRPKPNYELRFNGDFTRWSVFDYECLTVRGKACSLNPDGSDSTGSVRNRQTRDWHNGFALRGGGSYFFTPALEAFGQLGFDSGAVPMKTLDPSVVDGRSMSGLVGGRIRVANMLAFLLSYELQGFFERDSTGKNRLADSQAPARLPNAGGVYSQSVHTLNGFVEFYLN